MATLHPSLSIRPCCYNCGAAEASKLTASASCISRKEITQGLGKMVVEKGSWLEKLQSLSRSHCGHNLRVFAAARVPVRKAERIFSTSTKIDKLKQVSSYLFRH